MEIAQLVFDAGLADNAEVQGEAERLIMEPVPQPERIVELWNRLRAVSGSNQSPSVDLPTYSCGYNTVSGAFHAPGCDGECGIMNPADSVVRYRMERRKLAARKEKGE